MFENLFNGIFDSETAAVISVTDFLICIACSLAVGLILAAAYMYKTVYTKSFVITLALLPATVCVVIMMVNGNIGAGVAVAGAFSLVRFRSIPGNAKEIGILFLAMTSGLILGMGYLAYGFLFAILFGAVILLYTKLNLGASKSALLNKTLRITIPEDLDYSDVFDDLFYEYTSDCELISVKTANMGSLFRLTYNLTLKKGVSEKEFIDKLRCRNGNLEITVSKQENINSNL